MGRRMLGKLAVQIALFALQSQAPLLFAAWA